jgi:HlyD family secretion protein
MGQSPNAPETSPFDALLDPQSDATPARQAAPRRTRLRRLLGVTALAAVIGGGVLAYSSLRAEKRAPVTYRTAPVERGDVVKTVTATGTLSPRVTVSVGAQVSGRILSLEADYNSQVKKGQVIARLEPQLIAADVQKAKANLAAAYAKVSQARTKAREAKLAYERDRELAKKGVVSNAELTSRRATYLSSAAEVKVANAQVAQAKATLSLAKTKLAQTTIRSPIDGVVVSRAVDVGQTVAASLSAPTLFTIAQDLTAMEVHTSVAESDVGKLAAGMEARISVDAYPDKTFVGLVKQVRYEAQTVQNVVTYDAVISVQNTARLLRPGMTANVTFVVAKREGVLRVANAATRFRLGAANSKREGANRRRVYVLRDGKPQQLRVTLGLADTSHTELKDAGALKAGDTLIVGVQGGGGAKAKAKAKTSASNKAGQAKRRGGRRGPRRIF